MNLQDYITLGHIEAMNKVIVLTGSIVGCAYLTELFMAWYSMVPFEQDIFFKYRDEGKRLNDFINYLLNEYTFDKVASIIHKSGYNKYSEEHEFMLKKK